MENRFDEYIIRNQTFRYYKEKHVQNEDDAYLIGFMACDGAFINNDRCTKMSINNTQLNIIEWFKDNYSPDTKIEETGIKVTKRVNAINPVYELKFSAKMRDFWNNHGIFCYKKDRRLIGIKHKFFWAYFAGCIDGDGFVTVAKRKDQRTESIRVFITHESERFLEDLQHKLMEFNIASGLKEHDSGNCYRLGIQSKFALMPILEKIEPHLKNQQKKKIVNDYLNKYYRK
jgi:intein/homing endonuclease